MQDNRIDAPRVGRREFLGGAVGAGVGIALAATPAPATVAAPRRVRVGVIGCGSVSHRYLPDLAACPHVELVSACDRVRERAVDQAKRHGIASVYAGVAEQLAGTPLDFLVNLTDMQEHEAINRAAVAAGKHVWSEKPIANTHEAGREIVAAAAAKGLRVWGAPIVVHSPQFRFMAGAIAAGKLGRVASAQGFYGHTGPDWSSFFYEPGGGSMPDLGVYNMTTLTGLLGPAKSVTAMLSVVTPTREIYGKGTVKVTEEDNAMVLLEHEGGALSNIQCGFNFFNPHGHEGAKETRHTVTVYGSQGVMGLVGYDWEPLGVDLATHDRQEWVRHAEDTKGYLWQQGASLAATQLATGEGDLLFAPEHALHVVEVITAARESQKSGRRVTLKSTFKWPVVG